MARTTQPISGIEKRNKIKIYRAQRAAAGYQVVASDREILEHLDNEQASYAPRRAASAARATVSSLRTLATGVSYIAIIAYHGVLKPSAWIAKNFVAKPLKKYADWHGNLKTKYGLPLAAMEFALAAVGIQATGYVDVPGADRVDNTLRTVIQRRIDVRHDQIVAAAVRDIKDGQMRSTLDQKKVAVLPHDIILAKSQDAAEFSSEVYASVAPEVVVALYKTLQDSRTNIQAADANGDVSKVSTFRMWLNQDPGMQDFKKDVRAEVAAGREDLSARLSRGGHPVIASWVKPTYQADIAYNPAIKVQRNGLPQPVEITMLALASANNPDQLRIFDQMRAGLASRYQAKAAFSTPDMLQTYYNLEAAFKVMPYYAKNTAGMDQNTLMENALGEAQRISTNAVMADSQSIGTAVNKLHSQSHLFADGSLPSGMAQGILAASAVTGMPKAIGFTMVKESGMDADIHAGPTKYASSATGFGQFVEGTWNKVLSRHGQQTLVKLRALAQENPNGLVDYGTMTKKMENLMSAKHAGDTKAVLAARNDEMLAPIFTYWLGYDNADDIQFALTQKVSQSEAGMRNANRTNVETTRTARQVTLAAAQYYQANRGDYSYARLAHTIGATSVADLIIAKVSGSHASAGSVLRDAGLVKVVVNNPDIFRSKGGERTLDQILEYVQPPLSETMANDTLVEAATNNLWNRKRGMIAQAEVPRHIAAKAMSVVASLQAAASTLSQSAAKPAVKSAALPAKKEAAPSNAVADNVANVLQGTSETRRTKRIEVAARVKPVEAPAHLSVRVADYSPVARGLGNMRVSIAARDGEVDCMLHDGSKTVATKTIHNPAGTWAADFKLCHTMMATRVSDVRSVSTKRAHVGQRTDSEKALDALFRKDL